MNAQVTHLNVKLGYYSAVIENRLKAVFTVLKSGRINLNDVLVGALDAAGVHEVINKTSGERLTIEIKELHKVGSPFRAHSGDNSQQMTTRTDILHRLEHAPVRANLVAVQREAVNLIVHSAICEVAGSKSRLSAAHYAGIYKRRADNPDPAVKAIPGLLLSLENFLNETGNLELVSCTLDGGSIIALWFAAEDELLGCMLPASL